MATTTSPRTPDRRVSGILRPVARSSDALAFGIAALVIVTAFGLVLAKTHAITAGDLRVDQALSRAHAGAPAVTALAHAVYLVISPAPAIVLTAVVCALIWWRTHRLLPAVTFGVIVAVSWIPSDIVKIVVHRPRPAASALAHPYLPTPPDPSYPSGHVVFAASIMMALILLARGTRWQGLAIGLGALAAAVVAFSVMWLGVHYPTDVAAALIWAVGASTVIVTLWNRHVAPRFQGSATRPARGRRSLG